jgi:hypothetical protein
MYVNGKIISVETISGMGGGEIKENSGGGEFKYDIFDIRTFVNATMYTQHNNKTNKKKKLNSFSCSIRELRSQDKLTSKSRDAHPKRHSN